MNWLSLIGIFAKPIGALINKGIAACAAAVIATSVAHGNPVGDITQVVAALALGVSTLISGLAATQGVQIPVINADQTNGVQVVKANSGGQVVNAPLK